MVDHVTALVYSWFKYEATVEHLMDLASRYTRSAYLVPTRKQDVYDYLSGWIRLFNRVHQRIPEFMENDPEWSTTDLGAVLVGLPGYDPQGPVDPLGFLARVFRRQLEWCVAYFEFCRDEYVSVTEERTGPREFCLFANQAQTSWRELTLAPISVTPPQREHRSE